MCENCKAKDEQIKKLQSEIEEALNANNTTQDELHELKKTKIKLEGENKTLKTNNDELNERFKELEVDDKEGKNSEQPETLENKELSEFNNLLESIGD